MLSSQNEPRSDLSQQKSDRLNNVSFVLLQPLPFVVSIYICEDQRIRLFCH